jgi:hypothetical protein
MRFLFEFFTIPMRLFICLNHGPYQDLLGEWNESEIQQRLVFAAQETESSSAIEMGVLLLLNSQGVCCCLSPKGFAAA